VTRAAATLPILLGGFVGDPFGGTAGADEVYILARSRACPRPRPSRR